MNFVLISQASFVRRAVLPCLIAASLAISAQASEPIGPLGDPSQYPPQQWPTGEAAFPPAAQLPPQTPPEQSPAMRSPEQIIADPDHESEPGVELLSTPPKTQTRPPSPVWKLFPLGMIPYVGPRTPDEQKHRGIWGPLDSGGWRNQPFAITGFAGVTDGGPIRQGHVNQRPSAYEGLNFSWDYDHYWGFEKRLGFGELSLTNAAHHALSTGGSITGEYRLMYYPLGNSRWRPFLTAGVGWSDFYYHDDQDTQHIDTVFNVPFGAGLKYLYSERIAFRADLIDEFTVGYGAISSFHYVALTAGIEFRYGKRLLHLPWHRKDDGS